MIAKNVGEQVTRKINITINYNDIIGNNNYQANYEVIKP